MESNMQYTHTKVFSNWEKINIQSWKNLISLIFSYLIGSYENTIPEFITSPKME